MRTQIRKSKTTQSRTHKVFRACCGLNSRWQWTNCMPGVRLTSCLTIAQHRMCWIKHNGPCERNNNRILSFGKEPLLHTVSITVFNISLQQNWSSSSSLLLCTFTSFLILLLILAKYMHPTVYLHTYTHKSSMTSPLRNKFLTQCVCF